VSVRVTGTVFLNIFYKHTVQFMQVIWSNSTKVNIFSHCCVCIAMLGCLVSISQNIKSHDMNFLWYMAIFGRNWCYKRQGQRVRCFSLRKVKGSTELTLLKQKVIYSWDKKAGAFRRETVNKKFKKSLNFF